MSPPKPRATLIPLFSMQNETFRVSFSTVSSRQLLSFRHFSSVAGNQAASRLSAVESMWRARKSLVFTKGMLDFSSRAVSLALSCLRSQSVRISRYLFGSPAMALRTVRRASKRARVLSGDPHEEGKVSRFASAEQKGLRRWRRYDANPSFTATRVIHVRKLASKRNVERRSQAFRNVS